MDDLLQLERCRSTTPSRLPPQMEMVSTPLDWREWDRSLASHPDQRFRSYVVNGIRFGFRVGFDYNASCGRSTRNMASTREHPQVIRDYLAIECSEGRVLGPLDLSCFPLVTTSRFGVIPKGTTGKWRLIVDLSSPEGASVNDGIAENLCSLSYIGVDNAAREVWRLGQGALLAKVDVKSAYRNIPIHPEDRWLLGMRWEGGLYIDTALPFGLRSAPKIFTAVADAAEWILKAEGVKFVIHYLDDFLVIGAPGSRECVSALTTLLRVFGRLGLPIAVNKLEGPVTCLTFLGFELDSMAMEIRLPPAKLAELQSILASWSGRRSCCKKELESLVGKLAHACKVVRPGKTFLRRMFELLSGVRQPHHHVRLNVPFRSDLVWWSTFIGAWNGVSLLRDLSPGTVSHRFVTDASGQFGCGALWRSNWLQLKWASPSREDSFNLPEASITLQELLPVVLACAVWGPEWKHTLVEVYCDNQGAVAVVNSGYSKVPQMMHLLRCLFFIRAFFSFSLRAIHVPGCENGLADAISRNNLAYLFAQIPEAVHSRCQIPQPLLELLVEQHPDWTSITWSQLFRSCFRRA